jgi:hypothetical protein
MDCACRWREADLRGRAGSVKTIRLADGVQKSLLFAEAEISLPGSIGGFRVRV